MSTLLKKPGLGQENDELDLNLLFNQLLEHKWIILVVTLFCLGLGFLYTLRLAPIYQPDTLIQIDENSNNANSTVGSVKDQFFFGGRNNQSQIQTSLIKSRYILEPVIKSLGLDIRIKVKQSLIGRIISPSHAEASVKTFIIPAKLIKHKFKLVYDKENHLSLYNEANHLVLQGPIGAVNKSADNSIKLQVNKLKAPVGTVFTLSKLTTPQIIDALNGSLKIEDMGGKINIGLLHIAFTDTHPDKAVRILNEITKVTQKADAKKKLLEASTTLGFLYQQLPIARKELEKAELALNQYRAKNGKIDIKQQTKTLLEQLNAVDEELAKAELKKLELSQQITDKHPQFIALNEQMRSLNKTKYQMESSLKHLPASNQVAVNLLRETKVRNALYTILLNKIQELQVIKAGTLSNVRILSKAKRPDAALPSSHKIVYGGSIILSLLINGLLIFGRKIVSPPIDDPHWSERHFDIVNLAIIPYSEEQYSQSHPLNLTNNKSLPLLAHLNPRNLSIESLRSLRTNLQLNLACATNNIISILGVCPGVGKTFISTNLAYLLAMTEKKVLIIDADLRRGSAHKYFDVAADNGLAELLQGSISIETATRTTQHQNLSVIPRGHYPADPSELLSSKRFSELLTTISKQFDLVIIDTPPILLVTDAVLIASLSSINYLVLGSSVHQPADVELVLKRLSGAGIVVNGSIFNFHNSEKKNPYTYKYTYYYDKNLTT